MTARIYTVFEFLKAEPNGIINYRRHLAAGNSFDEARDAFEGREVFEVDSCAFMTSDDAAERCRYEIMSNVHMERDQQGMTREDLKRWVNMHTAVHFDSGERIEPSHVLIHGERYIP